MAPPPLTPTEEDSEEMKGSGVGIELASSQTSTYNKQARFKPSSQFIVKVMTRGIYQKRLVADLREIRLLTVVGVDVHGTIVCNLTTVSLITQPRPTFNALSYVWGDSNQQKTVTVNGVPMTVTANLELALRSLLDRLPSANLSKATIDTPIWIDAVCINQNDLVERGHQVSMMDSIYSAAHLVLIFLGKGDLHTDWAMERLNDAQFRDEMHRLGQINFDNARHLNEEQIRLTHILGKNINRRAWWSRMWVLQELVLASRDPIIIVGKRDIQWSKYVDFYMTGMGFSSNYALLYPDRWKEIGKGLETYPLISSSIGFWHQTRNRYQKEGALRFVDIFPRLLMSQATDDRDLVYGCLGLAHAEDASRIVVDYARPAMDVFQSVAALIWSSKDPKALSESIQSFSFKRSPDMAKYPSWVPNFAIQNLEESEWFTASGLYEEPAWEETPIFGSVNITIGESGKVLKMRAVVLDTIVAEFYVDRFYGSGVRSLEADDLELLRRLEDMIMGVKDKEVDSNHPLYTLRDLRCKNTVPETLVYFHEESEAGSAADLMLMWNTLLGQRQSCSTTTQGLSTWTGDRESETGKLTTDSLVLLLEALDRRIAYRKVIITDVGFAGVGTANLEIGDLVVSPHGADCFYVLRPVPPGYEMVGFAYLAGLRDLDRINMAVQDGLLQDVILDIH
ncbi:hypothetical protein N0V93_002487 [Gnomoniopsis smithogilvyi]|uniref:Heterokaryon incompatibility domain-containing protein n=1 Tax=Gnomoniopsis smithogilvyi TaxID=1191159 RepID=A0A9W8YWK2_9PEZI|nr:hypothetical protein N0V93_002487 [Gnomoniopsis smithogilvyi]